MGLGGINLPTPPVKTERPHIPKSAELLDQFGRSLDALDRLGTWLLHPRREDLKRPIDEHAISNQLIIPQT
jgi:hypothetical protein